MSLREDCIKEWFKDMQGKSFETRMEAMINKVLDAADTTAKELIDPQGYVPYWRLKEAINKLRGE